jgi:hypothetical protein
VLPKKWMTVMVISASLFSSGLTIGKEQYVSASIDTTVISPGELITLTVMYTSTNNELSTGLGLNLHYDSTKLFQAMPENILEIDNLGYQFSQDTEDLDGSSSTDKLFKVNWAALNGNWPAGYDLPVTLFTITFKATDSFSDTALNFSASSSAAGFDFNGESVALTLNQSFVAEDTLSGLKLTLIKAFLDKQRAVQ